MPNYRLKLPASLYVNVEAETSEAAIANVEGYIEDMCLTSGASGWTLHWGYHRPAIAWPEGSGTIVDGIAPDGVTGEYVPGSYGRMISRILANEDIFGDNGEDE